MTRIPSNWLRISEWLLSRRWWLVAVAMSGVIAYETFEYRPFTKGVNELFIFEVMVYGVSLPILTGLAFSLFASTRSELAWSIYSQNLRQNLRLQMNNAHTYKDVAEVLLQFLRVIFPLVKFTGFELDQSSGCYRTIRTWSLEKGWHPDSPRFDCQSRNCPLTESDSESATILPVPCRDTEIDPPADRYPSYCMVLLFSEMRVGGYRFWLEPNSQLDPERSRLLAEVAPGLASGFERARLRAMEGEQKASLHAEQHRIARDIHDTLGHSLAYLRLRLDQITMEMQQTEANSVRREVEALQEVARESYEQMREVLDMLTPQENSPLTERLFELAQTVCQRAGIRLHPKQFGQSQALPIDIENNLFRIVQESFANIQQHANAQKVDFEIQWRLTHLEIRIIDNGRGFDRNLPSPDGHYGLPNMRKRALEIGGRLDIDSRPGQGTKIRVLVPYGGAL